MFKLESSRLKREFKIIENNFFASQILNKYSQMNFVPDGNGCEFVVHFANGDEFMSKGTAVVSSKEENGRLTFVFEERFGTTVTLSYWVHNDGNTICKQIMLDQSEDNVIDYVLLENVGIINSKTHFSVRGVKGSEIPAPWTALGQPFYVDSLFFGCEFPATDNRIVHGAGQIKYYMGKKAGTQFLCPVTVIGAAADNTMAGVQKAFFDYIEFISVKSTLRFQYNSWYDHMLNIDKDNIYTSFKEVKKELDAHCAPALDAYVVDDGWNDYKGKFWSFNKKFPNKMYDITKQCKEDLNSNFGMWLGPRGGYNYNKSFAKRMQRAKNGYYNAEAKDICVASKRYLDNLQEFLIECTTEFDIDYWKLDGFCLNPCKNESHDHIVGGDNDMYFVTELWHRWIKLFESLRNARAKMSKDMWINMTCYVNVSPWWLQWVNSLWIQNSGDIGFAKNLDSQPQVEAEITYRDGRYYDCLCTRSLQFPTKHIYNHEPIYGNTAKVKYTDEEFEKYIYWCTVRGQALNELHLSYNMMNDAKWTLLANAMNWQKDNYYILEHASFIGGDPTDNNIYGYISWAENGDGVIAMRNPTDEKTALTLTLNKLMGTPETLSNAKRVNVYNKSMPETQETFSYNDKIDLTLLPFEVMIFKFINGSNTEKEE